MKTPGSLRGALDLLLKDGWKPFAGGTDVMVLYEAGKLTHKKWLNLMELKELRGIKVQAREVGIGATVSYAELQEHPLVAKEFPLLCQAARATGAPAIQSRGTLGGNIANASPAADSPPALLVYDAEVEILGRGGTRRKPLHEFYVDYKKVLLEKGEIIARIWLPRQKLRGAQFVYRKVGTREAQAISKVCFAGMFQLDAKKKIQAVRLAMGAVAPIPLRLKRLEEQLLGMKITDLTLFGLKQSLAAEVRPISDIRSNEAYRRTVAAHLVADFLGLSR